MGKRQPKIVENVPDSEDEEISEDGAFDSDDERMYGAFFDDTHSGSDASSDDDDDDSEDGDGGQYMLDLLSQLDAKPNAKDEDDDTKKTAAVHGKESPSAVGPSGQTVTLDALMEGIQDTQGFGALQKSMKQLVRPTTAPVPKVVSDRAHRKVQYKEQTQDVSQWSDAVQANRKAETLDFRPKERLDMTRDVMLAKFVPTTDLEKEIHAALEEAGETEEALRQAEDDLGANTMTIEEYRERRSELAKMRALMFYHEQKRHKINKIKSKQYRRIRKRQREKQKELEAEDNPELIRELREKEEIERMQERATLAHKNTSKWAKRILKRGKNVDADTRKALSAQLKRGDDLRKRMQSTAGSDDDDEEDEDLIAAATKTLEEDDEDRESNEKGIFKLAFMQKGVERQREKAKEEARQLLLELKAMEEERHDSDSDEISKKPKRKKAAAATKEEMKAVMKDGDLMVSSIKFNNGTNVATSGTIDVGDFGAEQQGRVEEISTTYEQTKQVTTKPRSTVGATTSRKGVVSAPTPTTKAQSNVEDDNPWLPSDEKKQVKTSTGSKRKAPLRGYVDVERAVDLLDSTPKTGELADEPLEDSHTDKKITMLTQEELVQKAFAAPPQEEVEGEFEAEKELARQEEVANSRKKKKRDMTSSDGWGAWAGSGVRPPKRARPAVTEDKIVPKRKDDRRPNVIISQARIKRTANKYMLKDVPYPFTSREEYEKSLKGGIGKEWNVSSGVKAYTRPEIITRAGKIIKPISKKMKVKRAPAKF